MKIRNISFVEQYIEKIVLGIAALACIVVLWLFVLGNPYVVELQGGKGTPVGEVEDKVRNSISRLERELRSGNSDIEDVAITGFTDSFKERHALALTDIGGGRFPMLINQPGLLRSHCVGEAGPEAPEYATILPPAPTELMARAGHFVMLERGDLETALIERSSGGTEGTPDMQSVNREVDALVRLVGDGTRDFASVTVMAQFDLGEYIEQLEKADVAEDGRPLPPASWWRTRLQFTEIVLERQTLDPETGEWPADDEFEKVRSVAVSGALNQDQTDGREWAPDEMGMMLADLRDPTTQSRIQRPPFVPIDEVVPWLPPDEQLKELTPKQEKELFEINRKLERLRDQAQHLMSQQMRLQRQEAIRQQRQQQQGTNRNQRTTPRNAVRAGGLGDTDGGRGKRGSSRRSERSETRRSRDRDRDRERPSRANRQQVERNAPTDEARISEKMTRIQEDMGKLLLKKDELLGFGSSEDDKATDGASSRRHDRMMPTMGPGGFGGPGGIGPSRGFGGPGGIGPSRGFGGLGSRGFAGSMGTNFGGGRRGVGLNPGFRQPAGLGRQPAGRFRPNAVPGRGRDEEQGAEHALMIDVWNHDLTVRPGKTYRYRLRVSMLNPLFNRDALNPNQKQTVGRQVSITSSPTPWGEKVEIDPMIDYFVVKVDRVNRKVDVEVFRYFEGVLRNETFSVTPGQPIGGVVEVERYGVKKKVDMSVAAVAVDVEVREGRDQQLAGSRSVLILLDESTQTLQERVAEVDRDHPRRLKFRNEVTREQELRGDPESGRTG